MSKEYVPLRCGKSDPINAIREFARVLTKFAEKYSSTRSVEYNKFIGVPMKDMYGIEAEYEPYERQQAIFGLNKFIEKYCKVVKIININELEDEICAPQYEELRISRTEYERLLTVGQVLLTWKKVKFVLEIDFSGEWCRKSTLVCKDPDKADKFNADLRKFIKEHNLFKGEKLVYLPKKEFNFLEYPNLGWNDVVLKENMKEEIIMNCLFPMSVGEECAECGIPWRRGLLFGGVAGTGKTQVCRILCNETPKGITVIWATPKALYDCDVMSTLFNAARYFSPTLLIIEDIDFIGTDRSMDNNDILGELLTQLDGNDPNNGLFIVATTNRVEILDLALANRPSRFDVKLDFPIPDGEEIEKLIKLFTKKMKFEHELDYGFLSTIMTGLTGAHIKEVFVYAQLKALKRKDRRIRLEDVKKRAAFYRKGNAKMVV